MKEKIKKYLAGRFEETDWIIIDELIYNMKISKDCKIEIEGNGITITTISREGAESVKINPALTAYNGALKNIKELCVKLGITVQDREKLKLVKPEKSEFEMKMHSNFNS